AGPTCRRTTRSAPRGRTTRRAWRRPAPRSPARPDGPRPHPSVTHRALEVADHVLGIHPGCDLHELPAVRAEVVEDLLRRVHEDRRREVLPPLSLSRGRDPTPVPGSSDARGDRPAGRPAAQGEEAAGRAHWGLRCEARAPSPRAGAHLLNGATAPGRRVGRRKSLGARDARWGRLPGGQPGQSAVVTTPPVTSTDNATASGRPFANISERPGSTDGNPRDGRCPSASGRATTATWARCSCVCPSP